MPRPIYMDYAAATPIDGRVLAAMQPFFAEEFYNPSSSYLAAKAVRQAVEDARARIAHWLGAKSAEVVFTAGATESINLAVHGVMLANSGGRVVASAIEHEAVLAAAGRYDHALAPVKPDGAVDLEALKNLIDDQTVLVSIGLANNEIGTIQPLREVARLVQDIRRLRQLKNNKLPLYLHTDASQAACYLDIHAASLGVDLLTLGGGKMYGPKQSGALFVGSRVVLRPLIFGGGQEMGLRAGTENVPGIIGLSVALDIAQTDRRVAATKVAALRDEFQRRLCQALPQIIVNGNQKKRLPNNLHVSLPGVDGERLLMQLDEAGIMASTGSACAANKGLSSHVLQAIGLAPDLIAGSLRLTLGRQTTQKQVARAAECIASLVAVNS